MRLHAPQPLLLAFLTPTITSPAVSTVTVSAPPQPTSTQYTLETDFQKALIVAHNFYRTEHNASALVWNDTSASSGASWSQACNFKHSGGPTGENLAAGYINASASVDAWGLERKSFDFKNPQFSEATGHFTQVIWKATTSVGCGRTQCDGQGHPSSPGWYVVCEYYPPGNVIGTFVQNVQMQIKGSATDTVESGVTKGVARKLGVGQMELLAVIGMGCIVAWL